MKTEGRTCGDCIACCTYPIVKEINKPGLTHCLNAILPDNFNDELTFTGKSECGNCKIYKTRPKPCKEYECAWLWGYGEEEDRPDRCGMIIDTTLNIPNLVEAKALRKGAEDTKAGILAVEHISRDINKPIAVAPYKELRTIRVIGRGIE